MENITLWEKTFGPIGVDGHACIQFGACGAVGNVLLGKVAKRGLHDTEEALVSLTQ